MLATGCPSMCLVSKFPLPNSICEFVLDALAGPFPGYNATRAPRWLEYEPNPTSVKNMVHWAQGIRSQKFQMYDYGTQGNNAHYYQPTPPQFNVTNWPLNLPIAILSGDSDALGDIYDVQTLLNNLPFNAVTLVRIYKSKLNPPTYETYSQTMVTWTFY